MPDQPLPESALSNERPSESNLSRLDFLTLAWKGLLGLSGLFGLAALWRYMSYQPDPAPITTFNLGPAAQYPVNSRTPFPAAQAVLIHNEQGFTAVSLICTHLGCITEFSDEGYSCPCHGSKFNLMGQVIHGPADKPLRLLRLETSSDGKLILHTDQNQVEATEPTK